MDFLYSLTIYFLVYFRTTESPENTVVSSTSELLLNRSDSGKTNTDVSECSTNTEDYMTCTDNSKRVSGTKPPSASSSSTTQVPGSNPISCEWVFDVSVFKCFFLYCFIA